jgi:ubiquinone/menaquinone biosynthesis C-methylase UbiE
MEARAWKHWTGSWKDDLIPKKQLMGVEVQLSSWLSGERVAPFDTCASLLRAIDGNLASVLEVGCSSGYYSKVIGRHHSESRYVGVDYSQAFCELGRSRFPAAHFVCGDSVRLPFRDSAFPLTISGSVLLHVRDWKAALRETLRVTSRYAILHRTPVASASTRAFTKQAYGKRLIEWSFNEDDLLRECGRFGFSLTQQIDLNGQTFLSDSGFAPNNRSYLLQRR